MIDLREAPTVGARGITFESRIAVTALATAVVVLILACGLFLFEQASAERADVSRALRVLTQILANEDAPAVARGDIAFVQTSLDALSSAPAVRRAQIIAPSGAVLAHLQAAPVSALDGDAFTSRTALMSQGRQVGELVLTVQPPPFIRFLPRYLAVCGALFFAAVSVALLLGRVLAGQVIRPVNRISLAMREVTDSGDYSKRVPDWARDEFGLLTDSFNTLLAQLQANDQALHKAMSDLVEARDAAQATNMLKSQFLANMSHEIRTPLNGVLAMAQIMAAGELSPDQRARAEIIRGSGEDLLGVLNDVLDLSRIEGGMMALEAAPFDLAGLAVRLEAAHRVAAAAKTAIRLRIELGAEAAGPRRGDQARIAQIMSNLISNALKFTHHGEVKVRLEGYGAEGREGIRLQVRDTGVGIAEQTLPLLFQKFSQADGSNTRRYGGAGLGLAICRELVRMMGGRIEVESVVGQGSTFTVTLPLPVIDPAAPPPAKTPGRALRVLAAEDIPTNQLVLRTIVEAFGAELHMVDNGQQALEAWRESMFDLILMDIQMPVMDGVAATEAIRAEEVQAARPRTPIIAVSANAMAHHTAAYLAAGMDAHVPKPIVLVRLEDAMIRVLGERAEGLRLSDPA